jgi:hypothetical protein
MPSGSISPATAPGLSDDPGLLAPSPPPQADSTSDADAAKAMIATGVRRAPINVDLLTSYSSIGKIGRMMSDL